LPQDHAQRRGFASPVRTQEPEAPAARHVEIYAPNGLLGAKVLGQAAGNYYGVGHEFLGF
jgi:hypothetical protein